jgi:hypothetical protein
MLRTERERERCARPYLRTDFTCMTTSLGHAEREKDKQTKGNCFKIKVKKKNCIFKTSSQEGLINPKVTWILNFIILKTFCKDICAYFHLEGKGK